MITLKSDSNPHNSKKTYCLLLSEQSPFDPAALRVQLMADLECRLVIFEFSEDFAAEHCWQQTTEQLLAGIQKLKLRQVSLISCSRETAAIAQSLTFEQPKLIRSLVLINGATTAEHKLADQVIQKIEDFLPLGLPLRKNSKRFDSKPFLQRLRCPVLLILTTNEPELIRENALLEQRIPTVWRKDCSQLSDCELLEKVCAELTEFEGVPAKCPQKNLRRESAT